MGPSGRGMPRSAPGTSPSNEGSFEDSEVVVVAAAAAPAAAAVSSFVRSLVR